MLWKIKILADSHDFWSKKNPLKLKTIEIILIYIFSLIQLVDSFIYSRDSIQWTFFDDIFRKIFHCNAFFLLSRNFAEKGVFEISFQTNFNPSVFGPFLSEFFFSV